MDHFTARVINFLAYIIGISMITGRFWTALAIATFATVLAMIGYGWNAISFIGAALLIFGFASLFNLPLFSVVAGP